MKKIQSQKLFLLFLYINVFFKGIGMSSDDVLYIAVLIFGIFTLFFKIASDNFNRNELLYFAITLCIGLGTFLVGSKTTLLLSCMCIVGMKNIDVDKTFKGMYKIRFITFIIVITLALLGILENDVIYMWRSGGYDTRYTLGFGHPNTLHLAFFILASLYIYNKYEKLKIMDYLIVILFNLFIFSYSYSRTGFIVTSLLVFITILSKNKYLKKVINQMPIYIFIGAIMITFMTAYLYGKIPIMSTLDQLLNGRIAYSSYYLNTYKLTLFGSNTTIDANAIFDNGYLYIYTQFGLLGFLLIVSWIIKICKKTVIDKNTKRAVLIICYLIYVFTESFAPNIFMNIILLFVADNIFEKKEISNEKIKYNNSGI